MECVEWPEEHHWLKPVQLQTTGWDAVNDTNKLNQLFKFHNKPCAHLHSGAFPPIKWTRADFTSCVIVPVTLLVLVLYTGYFPTDQEVLGPSLLYRAKLIIAV